MVTGTKQPRVRLGDHAGPEFDARVALCMQAVDPGAVHHLAQYNHGTPDFSIDVLEHLDPAWAPEGTGGRRQLDDIGHLGRQLHYMMRDVSAALAACDSGPLIRAVFDVGAGALLYYRIRPGEYLVGLVLGAASVPAADMALAGVVGDIRGLLSLPDQNPGGFAGDDDRPDPPTPAEAAMHSPVDAASLVISRSGAATAADDAFLERAVAELRHGWLHFAARFERSTWTSYADTLGDPRLRDFFTKISPRRRRLAYQEIGGHFHMLSGSVDRALYAVVGLRTRRTVLDLDEGALYVEHRGRDEHILGVTLVQKWVNDAAEDFDDLVRRHGEATTG